MNVGRIASLEIRTVVEALYVGSSERVELTGLDAYNNTFSTLEGMVFQWSAEPDFGDLMSISKLADEDVSVSESREWAEARGFSDSIVVRGLYPGPVMLHARPAQPAYADMPLAAKPVRVFERLRLAPPGPVCVAPGTAMRFTLLRAQADGAEDSVVLPSADFQWTSNDTTQVQAHDMVGAVRAAPAAAGRDATIAVHDRRVGASSLSATVRVRDMASVSVSLAPISAPALGGVRPLPVPPALMGDLSVFCPEAVDSEGHVPYSGTPLAPAEADETMPPQCVQRASVAGTPDAPWLMVAGAVYELRVSAFSAEHCPLWLGDNVAFNVTASEEDGVGDSPFRVLDSDVLAAPNGVVTPLLWEEHPSVASPWGDAPPAHPIAQKDSDALLRAAVDACKRPADSVAVPGRSAGTRGVGRVLQVVACRTATLRVDVQARVIIAPALPDSRIAGVDLSSPVGVRHATRNISRRAAIEAVGDKYSLAAVAASLPPPGASAVPADTWVAPAPAVPMLSHTASAAAAVSLAHPTTPLVLPFGPSVEHDSMYTLFPVGGFSAQYSLVQGSASVLTVSSAAAQHNVQVTSYNRSSRLGDAAVAHASPLEMFSGVLVADPADRFNALFVPVVLGEPTAVHFLPSLRHTQDGGRIILAVGATTSSGSGFTNCSALADVFQWGVQGSSVGNALTSIGARDAQQSSSVLQVRSAVEDLNVLDSVLCSRWQDYPPGAACAAWGMYHPPAASSSIWADTGVPSSAACAAIAPSNVAVGTVRVQAALQGTSLAAKASLAFSPRLKIAHPASAYAIAEHGTVVSAPTPEHGGVYIDAQADAEVAHGGTAERRWGNVRSSHTMLLPLGVTQTIVLEGGPMYAPHAADVHAARSVRGRYELAEGGTSNGITLKWLKDTHDVSAAADAVFSPFFMLQAACPRHEVPATMFKLTVSTNGHGPMFHEDVFVTVACKAPASVRPRVILPAAHAQEWIVELFEPASNSREGDNWLRNVEQALQGTPMLGAPMGPRHRADTGTQGNAFNANESSSVIQAPLADVPRVHYLVQADLYDNSSPPVKFTSKGDFKIDMAVGDSSDEQWLALDKVPLSAASVQNTFLYSPRDARVCSQWPPAVHSTTGSASCGATWNETAAVRCKGGVPALQSTLACLAEGALSSQVEGKRLVQLLQHAVFASELRVLSASFASLDTVLRGQLQLTASFKHDHLSHKAHLLGVPRLQLAGVRGHTEQVQSALVFRHPQHSVKLQCSGGSGDLTWYWSAGADSALPERHPSWTPLLSHGVGSQEHLSESFVDYSPLADYCREAKSFSQFPRVFQQVGVLGEGGAAQLLAVASGQVDVSCYDRGLEAAAIGRHKCSYTRQLRVQVQPVHALRLLSQTELYLGLRVPLRTEALNAAGDLFPSYQHAIMNITFSVSNTRVLSVQFTTDAATGERSYSVQAKQPGTAAVRAVLWNCALTGAAARGAPPGAVKGGCSATPAMHCTPVHSQTLYFNVFQSLHLMPRRIGLLPSAQLQLQPAGGPDLTKRSKTVWASSDENVATVSRNGTVTGISPGYAVITVTALGAAVGSHFEVLDSASSAIEVAVPSELRIVGPPGPILSGSAARLAFRGVAGLTALSLHQVETTAHWRVLCPRGVLALRSAVGGGKQHDTSDMVHDASVWVEAGHDASARSNAIVTVNVTIMTQRTRLHPAERIVLHAQLTVSTVPRLLLLSPQPAAPVLAKNSDCNPNTNGSVGTFSIAPSTGPTQDSATITVVVGSQLQFTTSLPGNEVNFKLLTLPETEPALAALTSGGWAQVRHATGHSIVEISHAASQQTLHAHIVSVKVGAVHLLGSSWLQFGEETPSHRLALVSVEGAPISLGEGVWTGLAEQPPFNPPNDPPAVGSGPVPAFSEEHQKLHAGGPLGAMGVFVSRADCVAAELRFDGSLTVRALSHGDAVITVWVPHVQGAPASGTRLHSLQSSQIEDEMMFMPNCDEADLNDPSVSQELVEACVVPAQGAFSAAVFTDYLVVHASSVLRPASHVVVVVGGQAHFELVAGVAGAGQTSSQWGSDDDYVLQVVGTGGAVVAYASAVGHTAVHVQSIQGGNTARARVPVTVTGLASLQAEWMGPARVLRVPLAPVTSAAHILGSAQVAVLSQAGTSVLVSEAERVATATSAMVDNGVAFRCSLPPGTPAFLVAVARGKGAWNALELQESQSAAVLAATGVDVSRRGLAESNPSTTDEAEDGTPECVVVLVPGVLEPRLHVSSPVVVAAPPGKLPASIKLQVLAAPRTVAPLDGAKGGVSFLWHRAHGHAVNNTLTLDVTSDVAVRPFDVRGRAGVAWLAPRNALLLSDEVSSALVPVYGSTRRLVVQSAHSRLLAQIVPRRAVGTAALGDGRSALLNITVLNARGGGAFLAEGGVRLFEGSELGGPSRELGMLNIVFDDGTAGKLLEGDEGAAFALSPVLVAVLAGAFVLFVLRGVMGSRPSGGASYVQSHAGGVDEAGTSAAEEAEEYLDTSQYAGGDVYDPLG